MSAAGGVPSWPSIQWAPIFAGAVVATGVSFTLHAFAAGIGLSVASTAPTWRDSTAWLWVISGLYLVFAALCAFAVGGYVAGRFRAPVATPATMTVSGPAARELEIRDGFHGLIMWGLAVLVTAVMALGIAAIAAPAPSGAAGAAQSVAGENTIASELDELFRSDRDVPNITYRRAEAARILLKASSRAGLSNADRDYLSVLAANAGGLDIERAQVRVDRVISETRDELHKARVAAVLQAFFIAAALFVGAAVAWECAVEGGRDREAGRFPVWDWSFSRRHPARHQAAE
jgi:hypothetical protein